MCPLVSLFLSLFLSLCLSTAGLLLCVPACLYAYSFLSVPNSRHASPVRAHFLEYDGCLRIQLQGNGGPLRNLQGESSFEGEEMVCMYTIRPTYAVIVAPESRLGAAGTIAQYSAAEAAYR